MTFDKTETGTLSREELKKTNGHQTINFGDSSNLRNTIQSEESFLEIFMIQRY